jgi:hypothetical protein
VVEIDYTNWKGERRLRKIIPQPNSLYEGSNDYHPEKQWLFNAIDTEDGRLKTWAMRGVHSWKDLQ